MSRSTLKKKINSLEEWLLVNPNHPEYLTKKRQLNNYYVQLKQKDINAAWPA